MSFNAIFTKEDLNNPNLKLPSLSKLASIFSTRKFTLEILPYKENKIRKFKVTYNLYNYYKIKT